MSDQPKPEPSESDRELADKILRCTMMVEDQSKFMPDVLHVIAEHLTPIRSNAARDAAELARMKSELAASEAWKSQSTAIRETLATALGTNPLALNPAEKLAEMAAAEIRRLTAWPDDQRTCGEISCDECNERAASMRAENFRLQRRLTVLESANDQNSQSVIDLAAQSASLRCDKCGDRLEYGATMIDVKPCQTCCVKPLAEAQNRADAAGAEVFNLRRELSQLKANIADPDETNGPTTGSRWAPA